MLTHVVLFKLKDKSPETLNKVKELLMNLEGKIPQLKYIEVGIDILHSERSYDISLITRFNSLEDMQAYQVHPAHVEVLNFLSTVRESSVAVDYNS